MTSAAGNVSNCQTSLYLMGSFAVIAIPANSFLFFLRVRAVYGHSKNATFFFGFCLVVNASTAFLAPFSANASVSENVHLRYVACDTYRCPFPSLMPPTAYRANTALHCHRRQSIYFDTHGCQHSLQHFSVFCHLTTHDVVLCFRRYLDWSHKGFCERRWHPYSLPNAPSRRPTVLLVSAAFFLKNADTNRRNASSASIGLSLTAAVATFCPIPVVYRAMLSVPALALENAMACRVFRAVILGFIENTNDTLADTSIILTTVAVESFHTRPEHPFPGFSSTPSLSTTMSLTEDGDGSDNASKRV